MTFYVFEIHSFESTQINFKNKVVCLSLVSTNSHICHRDVHLKQFHLKCFCFQIGLCCVITSSLLLTLAKVPDYSFYAKILLVADEYITYIRQKSDDVSIRE